MKYSAFHKLAQSMLRQLTFMGNIKMRRWNRFCLLFPQLTRVRMNPSQSWMLNAYQVTEQLYEGSQTLVYRGRRGDDQTPVILKMLKSDYPNLSELSQFRNQSTIAQKLNIPGVIKTHGLETYQNREVLVMEDFGGISLQQAIELWRSQDPEQVGVGLSRFFQIATQIVTALEGLSRHQVIHKDIKPANLLINLHTQQVKLIDFSIASCLNLATSSPLAVYALEGTLGFAIAAVCNIQRETLR